VSWCQKGKASLDLLEQETVSGSGISCTLSLTDNHVSTPPLSFFTGQMPLLLPIQQCQNTEGKVMNINVDKKLFQLKFVSYIVSAHLTCKKPVSFMCKVFFQNKWRNTTS